MSTTDLHTTAPAPPRSAREAPHADRGARTYIVVLLIVGACAAIYSLRAYGIFACSTTGYGVDGYLAYCQARNYGDYDHGAFWFDYEPAAVEAASHAQVLFIGNSRMQIGLSSRALADWFQSAGLSYYLMGFAYDANHTFEGPLIEKIQPRARAYVVNLDLFFEGETEPIKVVLHDPEARARYNRKRLWQRAHKGLCSRIPVACGDAVSFSRSRQTGAWIVAGEAEFPSAPVGYDDAVDADIVGRYAALGQAFLARLLVPRECVVLTSVPTARSHVGTARAVASTLGLPLVAPQLEGLNTFDASHLDQPSAERWSQAFMDAAGPQIRRCVTARSADADIVASGSDAL